MMLASVLAFAGAGVAGSRAARAEAASPPIPADARLLPIRVELTAIVDRAAQNGLPAEALISKVQEGLAKNVPPERILSVVRTLESELSAARAFAAPLAEGGKPSAALVRALASAHSAGIALGRTEPLLKAAPAGDGPVRGVEVLTDLAARGYPTDHAVSLVAAVLARDPQALGHLATDLERARRAHGLTKTETLDALASALAENPGAGGLSRALSHIDDSANPHGTPPGLQKDHGRGQNPAAPGSHGKK